MITYGHQIWSTGLNYKYQHDELRKMQRRTILALTRCYRSTSLVKLCGVLGVLEITKEPQYLKETRELSASEKNEHYNAMRRETSGDLIYEQIRKSRRKETLWFVTQHGPHRSHLRRI